MMEGRLFPIRPGTKRPLLAGWQQNATADPHELAGWLRHGCRLGLVLDGLVALDLDPEAAMDGLVAEFGALPPTWSQRTPRGGLHLLYSAEGFRQLCPWRRYPGGSVDVKAGPGSYIALYPPNGERRLPDLSGVVPLPEQLARALPRS